jgi:methylthioribose-1-phosphate isomerase
MIIQAIKFNGTTLEVIDQTLLPHISKTVEIASSEDAAKAISDMTVRGAGVIGNVGAYGAYFAAKEANGDINRYLELSSVVREARPTAVNLAWAVDGVTNAIKQNPQQMEKSALTEALRIEEAEIAGSRKIGEYGAKIIEKIYKKTGKPVQILTHCNAGALAILGYGSALAPVYIAAEKGIPTHVWVDETRPRNQGANLTAYELGLAGVEHTLIADNMGGLMMAQGMVDMCIVGADRVAANGDTANKIGTYLKALAAKAHKVPFYIALPTSTFDLSTNQGKKIEIEERCGDETLYMSGLDSDGQVRSVLVAPKGTRALNYGFDVTPAKLIKRLITEKGVCKPAKKSIAKLMACKK